jgi:hypothetical protein
MAFFFVFFVFSIQIIVGTINHSAPKPPLSTTLVINIIESIGESKSNKKLLLIHAPFNLHDAMMGAFSLLQSHYETNIFIEAIY